MIRTTFALRTACLTLSLAATVLAGCRVDHHTDNHGDDVKVATPFGGVSVKTNGADVQNKIGLDVYPGAVPEERKKDNDNAADVNLSFGDFHLGLKAASYTTPDDPAKVQAFYRKALARYGTVIQCRGNKPVGTPVRTDQGLTCENEGKHIQFDEENSSNELKAGSKTHQHVVSIDARGSGSKFGLVLLDLPSSLMNSSDKPDDKE